MYSYVYSLRYFLGVPIYSHHGVVTQLYPTRITHLTRDNGVVFDDSIENFVTSTLEGITGDGKLRWDGLKKIGDIERRLDDVKSGFIDVRFNQTFTCETFVIWLITGDHKPLIYSLRKQFMAGALIYALLNK